MPLAAHPSLVKKQHLFSEQCEDDGFYVVLTSVKRSFALKAAPDSPPPCDPLLAFDEAEPTPHPYKRLAQKYRRSRVNRNQSVSVSRSDDEHMLAIAKTFTRGYWSPFYPQASPLKTPDGDENQLSNVNSNEYTSVRYSRFFAHKYLLRTVNNGLGHPAEMDDEDDEGHSSAANGDSDVDGEDCQDETDQPANESISADAPLAQRNSSSAHSSLPASVTISSNIDTTDTSSPMGTNARAWHRARVRFSSKTSTLGLNEQTQSPSLTLPKLVTGFLGTAPGAMEMVRRGATAPAVTLSWEPPRAVSMHSLLTCLSDEEALHSLSAKGMDLLAKSSAGQLELGTRQRRLVRFCELSDSVACARIDVDVASPVMYAALSMPNSLPQAPHDPTHVAFFPHETTTVVSAKASQSPMASVQETNDDSESDSDDVNDGSSTPVLSPGRSLPGISQAAKDSAASAASIRPCAFVAPLFMNLSDPKSAVALLLKAPGDRGEYLPHHQRSRIRVPIVPSRSDGPHPVEYVEVIRTRPCSRVGIGLTVGPGYVTAQTAEDEDEVSLALQLQSEVQKAGPSRSTSQPQFPHAECLADEEGLEADRLIMLRRTWIRKLLRRENPQVMPRGSPSSVFPPQPTLLDPPNASIRHSHPFLWVSVPLIPMTSVVIGDVQVFIVDVVPVASKMKADELPTDLSQALALVAGSRKLAAEPDCSIIKSPAGFLVLSLSRSLRTTASANEHQWAYAKANLLFIENCAVAETKIVRDEDSLLALARYRWADEQLTNSGDANRDSTARCIRWRRALANDVMPSAPSLVQVSVEPECTGNASCEPHSTTVSSTPFTLPFSEELRTIAKRVGSSTANAIGFFDCYSNCPPPLKREQGQDQRDPLFTECGPWPSPWLTVNTWAPNSVRLLVDTCHCGQCGEAGCGPSLSDAEQHFDAESDPMAERTLVWHVSRSEDSLTVAEELRRRISYQQGAVGSENGEYGMRVDADPYRNLPEAEGESSMSVASETEGTRPPTIPHLHQAAEQTEQTTSDQSPQMHLSALPPLDLAVPHLQIPSSGAPSPAVTPGVWPLTQTAASFHRLHPTNFPRQSSSANPTPVAGSHPATVWEAPEAQLIGTRGIDTVFEGSSIGSAIKTSDSAPKTMSATHSVPSSELSMFSTAAAANAHLKSIFASAPPAGRLPIHQGDILVLSDRVWLRVDIRSSADKTASTRALSIVRGELKSTPTACLDAGAAADPNFETGLAAAISLVTPSRASLVANANSSLNTPSISSTVSNISPSSGAASRGISCMEDRLCFVDGFAGHPDHAFAAIFDGHCGDRTVADFAAAALHSNIAEAMIAELRHSRRSLTIDRICLILRRALGRLVTQLEGLMDAARYAGSTMLATLLWTHPISRRPYLFSAALGDSRGILCTDGIAEELVPATSLHKASLPGEAARLKRENVSTHGGRLLGLAVSRALGDLTMWPKGLSSQPTISCRRLGPLDSHLVVCSDGITDVVSPAVICNLLLEAELDVNPPTSSTGGSDGVPNAPQELVHSTVSGEPKDISRPMTSVGSPTNRGVPGSRGRLMQSPAAGTDGSPMLEQMRRERERAKAREKLKIDVKRSVYGKYLAACEKAGLQPHIPRPPLPSSFVERTNERGADVPAGGGSVSRYDLDFDPVTILRHWFEPLSDIETELPSGTGAEESVGVSLSPPPSESANEEKSIRNQILRLFHTHWYKRSPDPTVWEAMYELFGAKPKFYSGPITPLALSPRSEQPNSPINGSDVIESPLPSRASQHESAASSAFRVKMSTLRITAPSMTAAGLAEMLAREAKTRGTTDNVAVIVLRLNPAILPRSAGTMLTREAIRRHARAVVKDIARTRLWKLEKQYLRNMYAKQCTAEHSDVNSIQPGHPATEAANESDSDEEESDLQDHDAIVDVDDFYIGLDEEWMPRAGRSSGQPRLATPKSRELSLPGNTVTTHLQSQQNAEPETPATQEKQATPQVMAVMLTCKPNASPIDDAQGNVTAIPPLPPPSVQIPLGTSETVEPGPESVKFACRSFPTSFELGPANVLVSAVGEDEIKLAKHDVIEYQFEKEMDMAHQTGELDYYAKLLRKRASRAEGTRKKKLPDETNGVTEHATASGTDNGLALADLPLIVHSPDLILTMGPKRRQRGHHRVSSEELDEVLGLVPDTGAWDITEEESPQHKAHHYTPPGTTATAPTAISGLPTPQQTVVHGVSDRSSAAQVDSRSTSGTTLTPPLVQASPAVQRTSSTPSMFTSMLNSGPPQPTGQASSSLNHAHSTTSIAGLLNDTGRPRGSSAPMMPLPTGLAMLVTGKAQSNASAAPSNGPSNQVIPNPASTAEIREKLLKQLDRQLSATQFPPPPSSVVSPIVPNPSLQSAPATAMTGFQGSSSQASSPFAMLFQNPESRVNLDESKKAPNRSAIPDLFASLAPVKPIHDLGPLSETRTTAAADVIQEQSAARLMLSRTQSFSTSSATSQSSQQSKTPTVPGNEASIIAQTTAATPNQPALHPHMSTPQLGVGTPQKDRARAFQLQYLRKIQQHAVNQDASGLTSPTGTALSRMDPTTTGASAMNGVSIDETSVKLSANQAIRLRHGLHSSPPRKDPDTLSRSYISSTSSLSTAAVPGTAAQLAPSSTPSHVSAALIAEPSSTLAPAPVPAATTAQEPTTTSQVPASVATPAPTRTPAPAPGQHQANGTASPMPESASSSSLASLGNAASSASFTAAFGSAASSMHSWAYYTWVSSAAHNQNSILRSRAQAQTHALSQLQALNVSTNDIPPSSTRRELPEGSERNAISGTADLPAFMNSNLHSDAPTRPRGASALLSLFSQQDEGAQRQ